MQGPARKACGGSGAPGLDGEGKICGSDASDADAFSQTWTSRIIDIIVSLSDKEHCSWTYNGRSFKQDE